MKAKKEIRKWIVEVNVLTPTFFVSTNKLKALAEKILKAAESQATKSKIPPKNIRFLSVTICSDKFIHVLNLNYRGKDKPTDVLSFSHTEGIKNAGPNAPLGDLVISSQTLKRQAKEYGVTNMDELRRLLVHGVLHLFGYDHEGVSKKEIAEMEGLEDEIAEILS